MPALAVADGGWRRPVGIRFCNEVVWDGWAVEIEELTGPNVLIDTDESAHPPGSAQHPADRLTGGACHGGAKLSRLPAGPSVIRSQ